MSTSITPPTQGAGSSSSLGFEDDEGGRLVLAVREPDKLETAEVPTVAARIALAAVILILDRQTTSEDRFEIFYLTEGQAAGAFDGPPFALGTAVVPELPHQLSAHRLVCSKKQVAHHLASNTQHRLHVVVSTGSGTGLAQTFYVAVLQPILAALGLPSESSGGVWRAGIGTDDAFASRSEPAPLAGQPYSLHQTKDAQSVRELADRLQRDSMSSGRDAPAHTVILLSGDGGIVDMLNGFSGSTDSRVSQAKVTVALLPLGTGNALFHSLNRPLYSAAHAPSPNVLALRTLLNGASAPLPTFRASFSEGSLLMSGDQVMRPVTHLDGAIVASYGFHASLVWESDTQAYRKHGAARFGMAAQELLKVNHAYKASVEITKKHNEEADLSATLPGGELGYVLATMVSNLEQKFTISPDSKPLDGQLRLVSFGPVGSEKTMDIMNAAYADGKHVGMPEVGYTTFEHMKVTIHEDDARWRKVCIDGTIVEIPKGGWMRLEKVVGPSLDVLVDKSILG